MNKPKIKIKIPNVLGKIKGLKGSSKSKSGKGVVTSGGSSKFNKKTKVLLVGGSLVVAIAGSFLVFEGTTSNELSQVKDFSSKQFSKTANKAKSFAEKAKPAARKTFDSAVKTSKKSFGPSSNSLNPQAMGSSSDVMNKLRNSRSSDKKIRDLQDIDREVEAAIQKGLQRRTDLLDEEAEERALRRSTIAMKTALQAEAVKLMKSNKNLKDAFVVSMLEKDLGLDMGDKLGGGDGGSDVPGMSSSSSPMISLPINDPSSFNVHGNIAGGSRDQMVNLGTVERKTTSRSRSQRSLDNVVDSVNITSIARIKGKYYCDISYNGSPMRLKRGDVVSDKVKVADIRSSGVMFKGAGSLTKFKNMSHIDRQSKTSGVDLYTKVDRD